VGIKEVESGIWLASFMGYDLGHIDLEEKTSQSLLLNLVEDRRVERKPAGIHSEDLGDYVSM
jgi:hypothetical protein